MGGQGAIVPSQSSDSIANVSLSGNLKIDDDSMTMTYSQPSYDGSDIKIEYYVSGKAEINELSSNNNLLTAKSSDIQKVLFPKQSYNL